MGPEEREAALSHPGYPSAPGHGGRGRRFPDPAHQLPMDYPGRPERQAGMDRCLGAPSESKGRRPYRRYRPVPGHGKVPQYPRQGTRSAQGRRAAGEPSAREPGDFLTQHPAER